MGVGDGGQQNWVQFWHPMPTLASQHHPPTSNCLPMALAGTLQPPSPRPSTHLIIYTIRHSGSDGQPGLELGGHKAGLGQGQGGAQPLAGSSQTALPPELGFGVRE